MMQTKWRWWGSIGEELRELTNNPLKVIQNEDRKLRLMQTNAKRFKWCKQKDDDEDQSEKNSEKSENSQLSTKLKFCKSVYEPCWDWTKFSPNVRTAVTSWLIWFVVDYVIWFVHVVVVSISFLFSFSSFVCRTN